MSELVTISQSVSHSSATIPWEMKFPQDIRIKNVSLVDQFKIFFDIQLQHMKNIHSRERILFKIWQPSNKKRYIFLYSLCIISDQMIL